MSHGDDYYLKMKSATKRSRKYPATTPEFGHFRRPNPYEKKDFAASRKQFNNIGTELHNLFNKLITEVKKYD